MFAGNVIVHAGGGEIKVCEGGGHNREPSSRKGRSADPIYRRATAAGVGAWRDIFLEDRYVRRGQPRSCIDDGKAGGRRRAHRARSTSLAERFIFGVREKEQFIFQYGTTDLAAEPVIVESWIRSEALNGVQTVERVIVPVRIVDVRQTVKRIRPALDDRIELAAGRVAEFRRKLVLQERKFRYRVVRHHDQRSGDGLVVVVHTFNREVIVARTLTAHGWTRSNSDTPGGRHPSAEQGEVQNTTAGAASARNGRIRDVLRLKCRLQLGRRGIQGCYGSRNFHRGSCPLHVQGNQ